MTTSPPDIMSPELMTYPYREYGRLREQGAVVRGVFMGDTPAWFVTRFEEVRAVLGDPRFINDPASVPGAPATDVRRLYIERYGLPEDYARYMADSILAMDPPDHARLRKLVSRAFTVRRVTELRPRVEAIADQLLGGMTGRVDLVERFAYPLPITVICELVGLPEASRPAWRHWGRELTSMDPKLMPAAVRGMVDGAQALVDARRADPTTHDDLLGGLVRVHDEHDGRLSDTELVTFVMTLVLAGHETTAHLIGNGTVALLTHPDQLALLRERPELWPTAVHELMRWCGPVLVTKPRYAAADVELGGVRIRAGEIVQPVLVSANFDPRRYPDPDRLDVTRQPEGRGEGHVGFGHGAHYCLGAALARQEAEVALRALFERFPDLRLDVDPGELRWEQMPGSRRLAELPVRL
ncbi:cytochrome P450 family protein [Pseudonocardia acaciae]|uniref:cytochrome P450 family protein n=1 Tax=Pseudonocardia acaciae TaxID=551276 RepID=UPI00048BD335|nr:cytochrome P450 [Pseudonocardia acaciae]